LKRGQAAFPVLSDPSEIIAILSRFLLDGVRSESRESCMEIMKVRLVSSDL